MSETPETQQIKNKPKETVLTNIYQASMDNEQKYAVGVPALPKNTQKRLTKEEKSIANASENQNEISGTDAIDASSVPPLSKNAQKRLRKEEKWIANTSERKEFRKEKRLLKKDRLKLSRNESKNNGIPVDRPTKRRRNTPQTPSHINIAIDFDFSSFMLQKERYSVLGQVSRCYTSNNSLPLNLGLSIVAFNDEWMKDMQSRFPDYKKWKVWMHLARWVVFLKWHFGLGICNLGF